MQYAVRVDVLECRTELREPSHDLFAREGYVALRLCLEHLRKAAAVSKLHDDAEHLRTLEGPQVGHDVRVLQRRKHLHLVMHLAGVLRQVIERDLFRHCELALRAADENAPALCAGAQVRRLLERVVLHPVGRRARLRHAAHRRVCAGV